MLVGGILLYEMVLGALFSFEWRVHWFEVFGFFCADSLLFLEGACGPTSMQKVITYVGDKATMDRFFKSLKKRYCGRSAFMKIRDRSSAI